ncbi:Tetraspanin-1 [Amphibalanus amphitrite]|uniref:Tetraspanin-1 n=2 Tax=Amphibalanus amphitrite TaxID=1232801 RepID=A0A6A4UYC2_AMPAM|nr:Tetraspanin-1 [Amphibalanus amphitrite]
MKAMRYYRLWIYACNLVLLVSVLLFVAVGSSIFSDARMSLVSGVRYYQPTFLYAYAATVLQGGVVQVIGCVGALRLNERLLNVYWLLLLLLLCGDLAVGTVWVVRFQRLCAELPGQLSRRLANEYGVQAEFTALWDHVQWSERCCGLESPADFNASAWRWRNGVRDGADAGTELLPASCCPGRPAAAPPPKAAAYRSRKWSARFLQRPPPTLEPPPTTPLPPYNGTCVAAAGGRQSAPYGRGCRRLLMGWYQRSADLLFVLGYCVIAFLKLCFLGLLRCEIREMIQKIKVLQCEAAAVDRAETAASAAPPTANHITKDNNNGGGRRPVIDEPANASDSDTNSHCPLLGRPRCTPNGNNNTLAGQPNRSQAHELSELPARHQTAI